MQGYLIFYFLNMGIGYMNMMGVQGCRKVWLGFLFSLLSVYQLFDSCDRLIVEPYIYYWFYKIEFDKKLVECMPHGD